MDGTNNIPTDNSFVVPNVPMSTQDSITNNSYAVQSTSTMQIITNERNVENVHLTNTTPNKTILMPLPTEQVGHNNGNKNMHASSL